MRRPISRKGVEQDFEIHSGIDPYEGTTHDSPEGGRESSQGKDGAEQEGHIDSQPACHLLVVNRGANDGPQAGFLHKKPEAYGDEESYCGHHYPVAGDHDVAEAV